MRMLASFGMAEEAHMLRARLEDNGIVAYVRNEHTVTADWLYSNAVGGVKVDVADEDFVAASAFVLPRPVERSPTISRARSGRYFVTVFLVVAACTFVVVAVRGNLIAYPSEYAVPAGFGIGFGALAVALALLRSHARN